MLVLSGFPRTVAFGLAALCLVLAPLARAEEQGGGDAATRATMREIFAALSEILPRCLSDQGFAAPADREVVRSQLARIAERADTLAAHADATHADVASRGRVLADDARRASQRFASGRYVDARFMALHLTESCVGCHSRLPSDKDAPFAAKLIDDKKLQDLGPSQRARLAVATRQFDKSLDLYEALLTSPPPPDGEVTRGADLTEYLIVAVRVKRDPERAALLLDKLERRPETAPDVRRECDPWAVTLRSQGKVLSEKPSLARARSFVEAGRRARPYAFSRAGLVDDLIASSILHALLEDPKQPAAERAETYYLLGLTDAQVRASPWLSDAAWYLTSAIETAPHTSTAQKAFDAYEDMTLLSWTGSAGIDLPPDVTAELDRLRALAGPKKP